MARLLCRQENDGVQSGDVFEVATFGKTPDEYLALKDQSHRVGWTVSVASKQVHAFKTYPAAERSKDPNLPGRIDRWFWVEA